MNNSNEQVQSQHPASEVYNVQYWSDGYFGVDSSGEVTVKSQHRGEGFQGRFSTLVKRLEQADLRWPVLVRFSDILRDRVRQLCSAFEKAMTRENYDATYTAVYPIKVNQQRRVVEEIIAAGRNQNGHQVGLEAGSKPELLAVLALSQNPGDVIVCNGYKDREFVRLALMGLKLKRRVYIVIEKLSELELVLAESMALGVEPMMGVRVRLATVGKGNWQNTGGEKSKFGLSAKQILMFVDKLKAVGKLDSLQMLHFHMGSQISTAKDIQRCIKEAGRFFVELRRLGAPIDCIDVGGGLGVDYEGTRSRSPCSMNYSMDEYAQHIVHGMKDICETHEIAYPHIISESGRALTAHHAVLISKVIEIEKPYSAGLLSKPDDLASSIVADLWQDYQRVQMELGERDLIEVYHNLSYSIGELQSLFIHSVISIEEKSLGEQLYYGACDALRKKLKPAIRAHRSVLDELNEKLAHKLFCNFSVFQSTPDVWGIEQIFPIVPLVNLEGPLTERGRILDITCDSDGRIDTYVDGYGLESSLPLPLSLFDNIDESTMIEDFYLGIFMVGAYQEILGDLHNLFGDSDSVDVSLIAEDIFQLNNLQFGNTVEDVLAYVNFQADDLRQALISHFDQVELEAKEKQLMLSEMLEGLKGYTYLE